MRKKNEGLDFLAECSNEAIKMGVSYGKYMAMRYEKGIVRKKDYETNAICKFCGKPFLSTPLYKLYCSPECKDNAKDLSIKRANRKRYYAKKLDGGTDNG